MTEQNQKPELSKAQPSQVENTPKPPVQEAFPEPQTAEDKDFYKQVDAKLKPYEKKVADLRKKFGSENSIGAGKADVLSAMQVNRLRSKAGQKKREFLAVESNAKLGRMSIMLSETDQELAKIDFPYEKIIDYARGLDKIDDAELVKLEALMEAMTKLKTNPKLETLFYKALNKEKFLPKDFELLSSLINPLDIDKEIDNGKGDKIFEASQVGAVISVLNPADRLELTNVILKTHPPQEYAKILDIFTTAGILSTAQLKVLCESGKVAEPYKSDLLAQIDQGVQTKKQQDYQQKLDRMTTVNTGRTADPALSKTVGSPMLFALSSLWGACTMLVNFKAHFKWDKPLESTAQAITDPRFLVGTAALGVGAGGMLSTIAPEKYGKYKEKAVDFMSGPEYRQAKSASAEQELREYLEIPFKSNPYLAQFFTTVEEFPNGQKKNGFQILKEMIAEMQSKIPPQEIKFKLNEVMAKAGPKQQKFLTKALGVEAGNEFNLTDKLKATMACCSSLKIDSPQEFAKVMEDINKKQGLNNATA